MKKYAQTAWCTLKKHRLVVSTTLLLALWYTIGIFFYLGHSFAIQNHQSVALFELYQKILKKDNLEISEEEIREGKSLLIQNDTRIIHEWFDRVVSS